MNPPSNYLQQELNRLDQQIQEAQASLNDPQLKQLAQEELEKLQAQKQALQKAQPAKTKEKEPGTATGQLDQRNATIEIRAAAGGDEAKIWADDLLRMYTRYANQKGFRVLELDEDVIKIQGKNAFNTFKHEAGVHRVQRVPVTESQGRIHTSTATVAVLPEISATEIEIKPDDLEWQFSRAGGPGGQNVNKLNTAVRLTHKPSQIVISVRQERRQQQNKAIALQMLRDKLWQIETEKKQKKITATRRAAVGRGMRSEKIRTYNFPQNRLTDHRINKSWHNLDSILEGNLDKVIQALQNKSQ